MRNSTKWIAITCTVAATFFATNLKAQMAAHPTGVMRFGIGIEGGIPTGDFYNFSDFSLGGIASLQYDARRNMSFMLTSGYFNVYSKSYYLGGGKAPDAGIVPLTVGIKAFVSPNIYFSGELGAGFETNYAKNTKFLTVPGIGYANAQGLDISIRFENFWGQYDDYGLIGLRIAYNFKLKK